MVLPCHQGSILPPQACAASTTTNIEVCLLNGLHKGHMPTRVPSIKPTPDDGLNIVEAVNSPHPTKDDGLKDQGTLRVPATLYYTNLGARQGL